jgi:hypothetical protein
MTPSPNKPCAMCEAMGTLCTMHITNEDLFADIVSLCCKVAHEEETECKVQTVDLISLRDNISELRKRIARGEGYKSFPKLVPQYERNKEGP